MVIVHEAAAVANIMQICNGNGIRITNMKKAYRFSDTTKQELSGKLERLITNGEDDE